MSSYRRGTILGLTVAETFILLAFLLLFALLLGLLQQKQDDDSLLAAFENDESMEGVWERPDQVKALVNAAARRRAAAERERDQALATVEQAREAEEDAEQARVTAEDERDRALEEAEEARRAEERAQEERDRARQDYDVLYSKGSNPPCWYQVVDAGGGKTREKPHYAFNVAIYERSIVLAQIAVPPGGAEDDGGGSYAEEWARLRVGDLPYGQELSDDEFTQAVSRMVAEGRSRRVRTYECVFSVRVWDLTPVHAKRRWKDAHDRVIEGLFSAYTVQSLEWTGARPGGPDI